MMRVLLIAPRFVEKAGEMYDFPVGLAFISAVVKASGRQVVTLNLNHCYDNEVESKVRAAMTEHRIDIVGTGGLSPHYHSVKRVLRAVRSVDGHVPLVLGGGLITSEPELIFNDLGVDYGVVGEGEATILDLLDTLERGGDPVEVLGLVYRDQSGTVRRTAPRPPIMDLDALPFPDYEGFEANLYLSRQRTGDNIYANVLDRPRLLPIISSRSCPFNCTFCFHPLGNKYRTRSLDSFFAELDALTARYDINMLAVLDELFSFHTDRLEEFCRRMKPYALKWIAQLRVDHVDEPTLAKLKDAGLFYISYGLESASDTVLKSMRKHITVEQMDKALAATDAQHIGIQGNFIFGDPAETLETARETIAWWREHARYNINFTALIPYPGSQVYAFCLEKGLIADRLAFIKAGCPSVNMTALGPKEYGLIFQEAAKAQFEMLRPGRVQAVTPKAYDRDKKTRLYALDVECPHCGGRTLYDDFHKRELETFKIVCRNCLRRFDLASTLFEHIRRAFGPLIARLEALRDDKTPVALTPLTNEHALISRLALLGFAPEDFNIRCVLDFDPAKAGQTFLRGLPVHHRSPQNVAAHCAGHVFLITACERPLAVEAHLTGECGVPQERVLSLGHRLLTPGAAPVDAQTIAARLGQFHPELPGLAPLADPTSLLTSSGAESALHQAMAKLREQGVTRLGLIAPPSHLTAAVKAASTTGRFEELVYIDSVRENPIYAFDYRVLLPVKPQAAKAQDIQAVLAVRSAPGSQVEQDTAVLRADFDRPVTDFHPEAEGLGHIHRLAADIADKINRLQPDVLYVADFSYNNFSKQSLALRRKGWRTAALLQNPRSMDFKEGCFDGVFSTYSNHVCLYNVLAAVDVPVIHLQGWLTFHYLAVLVHSANPRAKLVVEFNDIGSVIGEWDTIKTIFGQSRGRLDEISERLTHELADGLIYNCSAPFARNVAQSYACDKPQLVFHSYPEREFSLPDPEVPAATPMDDDPRLVFIGSLAPSSLPAEAFGDVQLLPMIKNIVGQNTPFDVFLAPYSNKNDAHYADYCFFEQSSPLFRLVNGVSPRLLPQALAAYSFGVMFYTLKPGLLIGKKHFQGMLPTKFFTFIEAGLPIAVSEELEYVASLVADNGLGVVLTQKDLADIRPVLTRQKQRTLRENILAYREKLWMDSQIGRMESLYRAILD